MVSAQTVRTYEAMCWVQSWTYPPVTHPQRHRLTRSVREPEVNRFQHPQRPPALFRMRL